MFIHKGATETVGCFMARMGAPLLFFLSLILGASCAGGHEEVMVFRFGVGQVSLPDMIDDISSAKVVFVGEKHNNPNHHRTQFDVIKGLEEKGIPLSVGLEMFPAQNQQQLDDWINGKTSEKDFVRVFQQNWGFDYKLYRDIFRYARERKIPLIGLNVPHGITRKVARDGFESLSDRELEALPPGISCDLDQRYRDFIQRLFDLKGGPGKTFISFCEAQVIWDQTMAWHLADYLKKNPGRTVVVITGSVHAWKYGISRQLKKYIKADDKIILPDLPADYNSISKADADYLVFRGYRH